MITLDKHIPCDFLLITGDAWVDHPSFGAAVIAHVLQAEGYSVCVWAQPEWRDEGLYRGCPRPRLGIMVTGGNIDSMVAHYTAAKKPRHDDYYTPGGKAGKRPDRAVIVYSQLARRLFPGLPVILGGLEASLRRFAHYDYWDDTVRRSVLLDAQADVLVYGMGERATRLLAARLHEGQSLDGIRGTCIYRNNAAGEKVAVTLASFEACRDNKRAYFDATKLEYAEHDPVRGKTLIQAHGAGYVICYPPQKPLTAAEMDAVAEYPYTRLPDPSYTEPVPSIEEVRFSIIHNRGCFGSCRFCSLAFHQGRMISARSHESVLREAHAIAALPDFKGYIHDVGGPTANFRRNACRHQHKRGACRNRNCLTPEPCESLDADHSDYLSLLRKLRAVPKVKKVFIRSGIRFDYLLRDRDRSFFRELVEHHTSGQLKVAPEHCSDTVLRRMGKPKWSVFERFTAEYQKLNQAVGKQQFLVPYLISSHPGSTLNDAIELSLTLHRLRRQPEQVQDFYPTPGTLSTCMYHTELDIDTAQPLFVAKTPRDKAMQRALLQWKNPKNKPLVIAALRGAGREELINVFYPRPRPGGKPASKHTGKPTGKTFEKTDKKPASRKPKKPPRSKKRTP